MALSGLFGCTTADTEATAASAPPEVVAEPELPDVAVPDVVVVPEAPGFELPPQPANAAPTKSAATRTADARSTATS